MSAPSARRPIETACAVESGMCEHRAAIGHGLDAMRRRLTAATPSRWLDAVVEAVHPDGTLSLVTLDGGRVFGWQHEDLSLVLSPGEPVAVHTSYDVLAVGGHWRSLAMSAELAPSIF